MVAVSSTVTVVQDGVPKERLVRSVSLWCYIKLSYNEVVVVYVKYRLAGFGPGILVIGVLLLANNTIDIKSHKHSNLTCYY